MNLGKQKLDRVAAIYFGNDRFRFGWWYWVQRNAYLKPFMCGIKTVISLEDEKEWKAWKFRLWRFEINWRMEEIKP